VSGQCIPVVIGVVEGIVTAAILTFVYAARPQILLSSITPGISGASGTEVNTSSSLPVKKIIIIFACIAIALTGLSLFASQHPDGLEWAVFNTAGTNVPGAEGGIFDTFASIQERLSFMPDYDTAATGGFGAPVAGLIGAVLVFALAIAAVFIIRIVKKDRNRKA